MGIAEKFLMWIFYDLPSCRIDLKLERISFDSGTACLAGLLAKITGKFNYEKTCISFQVFQYKADDVQDMIFVVAKYKYEEKHSCD